jgi:flagellar export protein FliJ
MKKFVFSLSALFDVKKTAKDKLRAEFAAAEAMLQAAVRKKESLEKALDDKTAEYEQKAKKGLTVSDIGGYALYFEELQGQIKAAARDVDKAQKETNIKRNELIGVFKEIKVLEKLYEKQYREYLIEEGKSETKAVEDILSYNVSGVTEDNVISSMP